MANSVDFINLTPFVELKVLLDTYAIPTKCLSVNVCEYHQQAIIKMFTDSYLGKIPAFSQFPIKQLLGLLVHLTKPEVCIVCQQA